MPHRNTDITSQNGLMTVKEVATYLRVSRVTAWRWCQQGVIPAFRIGRHWRIRRGELLKLEMVSGPDHRGRSDEKR